MATGNFWDEYLQSQYSGTSSDQAKAAASSGPGPKPSVATPTPRPGAPTPTPAANPPQSYLPAANNFMQGDPSGQMTNLGPQFQPGNIPTPNDYRPGSIGSNLGSTLGQSFQNPYASMFNQQPQQQQPTVTGYHWYAGTGGVSGGNNANADLFLSNGTRQNMVGGLANLPTLGSTLPSAQPQYPQAPKEYPVTPEGNINYNVPGGSMQDALQKLGSTGSNYNSSTGRWLGY